uniref:VASt domain-containing protein n=1 Tax=Haemonchus placei TaxID=6290 RepID=A0A0N4WUL1_HAEPC
LLTFYPIEHDHWITSRYPLAMTNLVRKPGLPDALFPSVCPPSCSQLFHAEEAVLNDSLSDRCSCVCPSTAPVYLNTAGYCVDRLVAMSWRFQNTGAHPLSGKWEKIVTGIFQNHSSHHYPCAFQFRGSESDVAILTGSVVQLKLSCTGFAPDEHCLSFRVAGVSGSSPYLLPSTTLSIAGSFVVWHLCWRIKKRQLISDIQMQFLFHLQQQHEAQKVTVENWRESLALDAFDSDSSTKIPKRRLYFSAEYLDDAMMANPPPVAEQFLADLRRVIEVARERIRMRRFVPMLITIPEDHEETKSEKTEPTNQQESPKSDKSVDSGRESHDSSRDDEDDHPIKTKQPWMEPSGPERISSVRSIVSGMVFLRFHMIKS